MDLTTYFPLCYFKSLWGCSSAGRALEWHSRGRRFDPVQLHHLILLFGAYPVYNPKRRAVASTGRRFDPVQLHHLIFLFGAYPVHNQKGERSHRPADGRNRLGNDSVVPHRLAPSSIPFSSTIFYALLYIRPEE